MSERSRVIYPVFDFKHGFRYPYVKDVVGGPPEDTEFLNMLYKAGVLNRELYDVVIYCPKCGSTNVSTRYSCPYCGSFDIRKSSLIEHVKCGYMDVEEKFRVGNKLFCPKCQEELKDLDVDYRKAGVWCTCNKCGKSFDIPVPHHFCRECRHVFTFEEAVLKKVYAYSLIKEAVNQAALDWTVLAPIRGFLEERGFKVESPGIIDGKSSVKHMFDLVAHGIGVKRNVFAINVSISPDRKPIPDQHVIEMFAKTYDSEVDKAFLITIPKISESGRKLANLYKIQVIEARKPENALKKLETSLAS